METLNQVLNNLSSRKTFIRWLDFDQMFSLDFAELGDLIAANVNHFHAQGIKPGDAVAISIRCDVEHVVSFLALISLGAIPVSLKPRLAQSASYVAETEQLLDRYQINYRYHTLLPNSRSRPICWQAKPGGAKCSRPFEPQPDDVAFVQFSSGSTSDPKPIPITHRNLMSNLSAILSVESRRPDETAFNFLPLSHDMGLIGGLLSNFVYQNSLLLTTPDQFLRQPIEVLKKGQQFGIRGMAMPDFSLRYLSRVLSSARHSDVPDDLFTAIRFIYCGAEPIKLETIAGFITATAPLGLDPRALFFCYGLAEATLLVSGRHFETIETNFDQRGDRRPVASVGPAIGNTEIRIGEDRLGADLNGREGPIYLRGPAVFSGYWKEPPRQNGAWFRTGDIGYFRNGDLHISGREKEMLIVNGENIFPNDIENMIGARFDVRKCLVMMEDDQLYVLIVPDRLKPVSLKAISTQICATFGISPSGIFNGSAADILRTTSGKPKRNETLLAARNRGLLS
jgi:acyl-CoA synthetase (AMP-forming)/AMP-acid ligase II